MSNWKPWDKENLQELNGVRVLISFELPNGDFHIEDAVVNLDEDTPTYALFDGEWMDYKVTHWAHIPE